MPPEILAATLPIFYSSDIFRLIFFYLKKILKKFEKLVFFSLKKIKKFKFEKAQFTNNGVIQLYIAREGSGSGIRIR